MEENKKRKKRDTSKKRKIILDAAIQIFSQYGFDASSMDKIAETAGVSKITIYKHFQNKEILFQEIVSDFLKQSSQKKPIGYSSERPISDQLKDFIQAELYWIYNPVERGLSRLLASVYLFKIDFVLKTMEKHPFHSDFINWLNKAQEDGKLEFQSPRLAAQIFYGMIEGCITWNALLTDGASLADLDLLLNEIIDVFLNQYSVHPHSSAKL